MSRQHYHQRTKKFQRYWEGEEHHQHLLTEEEVAWAREMRREEGRTYYWLADDLGVSPTTVRLAVIGDTWHCVTAEPPVLE